MSKQFMLCTLFYLFTDMLADCGLSLFADSAQCTSRTASSPANAFSKPPPDLFTGLSCSPSGHLPPLSCAARSAASWLSWAAQSTPLATHLHGLHESLTLTTQCLARPSRLSPGIPNGWRLPGQQPGLSGLQPQTSVTSSPTHDSSVAWASSHETVPSGSINSDHQASIAQPICSLPEESGLPTPFPQPSSGLASHSTPFPLYEPDCSASEFESLSGEFSHPASLVPCLWIGAAGAQCSRQELEPLASHLICAFDSVPCPPAGPTGARTCSSVLSALFTVGWARSCCTT